MQYEYFYGAQAEQFSFYRIPKALFTEPNFRELSTDAKVLYGILLDRMSLSLKNQWLDAQNKVYIIFTVEEIMDALNCANQKATRLMVELEKQAGLIERKRQGLGRPNLIYNATDNYLALLSWQAEQYPDSIAAEIVNAPEAYAAPTGKTVYVGTLYTPSNAAWQRFVVLNYTPVVLSGDSEIPGFETGGESVDKPWSASYERSESLDFSYTVNTDKIQLDTLEKVDGAGIEIAPILDGIPADIDGGSWTITPDGMQSVTTSGHTSDDNYHLNGGDGSVTWTVHFSVSKSASQNGSITANSEQDADAQASAAQSAAQSACEGQVNGEIEAALSAAHNYFDNLKFSYNEVTVPHGFDAFGGEYGSSQTITVPANSSNDYLMKNDEWSVKVAIDKIDSETKQRIKGDAAFKIYEWDTVLQRYIPAGGYNQYAVERQPDGTYKVINHSSYANGSDNIYYTQRNEGRFVVVESRAPSGYYGDWTDVTNPGAAGSVLGKRAYAFEITKALDGQTLWLGNADYNADITTTNNGGTLIDTGEAIVTITFGDRATDKTYDTDPTGIANNEKSYTMHADGDKMQNDRVLGSILLTKVDLDAARYLAAGSNGDTTLEGAVYDLYDRVDGTYVINEEQAATVRRIFNLYAEGHGETTVAKMLIEENRKDGGGGLSWTASKVSRVLRKATYKGYMTYNKSHIDDFLSHNRINHSEENFVLVKENFEPIVSEELWETCNQIRSRRAAFVKGKDGRAHKFGVSFPQNKWTKILFCDCGMRFQIEGYDKTANGGKNMRLICARSKMFKKKDAARALNGIPCPAPYASEWKLELMAREVFRTVWKENAEDILGLLRMLDANLNTTGTPNDGNQLENKLSALNEELDDLVSQRASRSITMDDFLSKSTEINNEIINAEGLLQSSIQEQRPKARLDMHGIEAALSDDASFPDGKIEPGFLDRYANRIVKSNNRYIWMLQLMNVQQIMPIQSERQPIAMVTYKSGVPYDIEQEQIGKQDKESAGPDCATICRPQDFFLNMSRTKRKRKLVEWLESCQENQVSVLDEKIPLLSFAVDFVTAYEYQKSRGIKIHPGLWKDMRVDIFLVKKEN